MLVKKVACYVPNDKNGPFIGIYNTICNASAFDDRKEAGSSPKAWDEWIRIEMGSEEEERCQGLIVSTFPAWVQSQLEKDGMDLLYAFWTLSVMTSILCDSILLLIVKQEQTHCNALRWKERTDMRFPLLGWLSRGGRQEHTWAGAPSSRWTETLLSLTQGRWERGRGENSRKSRRMGSVCFPSLGLQDWQKSEVRLGDTFLCSLNSHMGERAWKNKRWCPTFWRSFLAVASSHKWQTRCSLFPQISPPWFLQLFSWYLSPIFIRKCCLALEQMQVCLLHRFSPHNTFYVFDNRHQKMCASATGCYRISWKVRPPFLLRMASDMKGIVHLCAHLRLSSLAGGL